MSYIIFAMAGCFTVAAYFVKRTAMASLAAVAWIIACGFSLSQLSFNPPIYTALALLGFISAIGLSIQAYGFRDKDEEAIDNESELTFEEQLKKSNEERREFNVSRKEAKETKESEKVKNQVDKRIRESERAAKRLGL